MSRRLAGIHTIVAELHTLRSSTSSELASGSDRFQSWRVSYSKLTPSHDIPQQDNGPGFSELNGQGQRVRVG